MSVYTRQKAKSKYRNRIRLERATQKQSSDTHKSLYNPVKRCRERMVLGNSVHNGVSSSGIVRVAACNCKWALFSRGVWEVENLFPHAAMTCSRTSESQTRTLPRQGLEHPAPGAAASGERVRSHQLSGKALRGRDFARLPATLLTLRLRPCAGLDLSSLPRFLPPPLIQHQAAPRVAGRIKNSPERLPSACAALRRLKVAVRGTPRRSRRVEMWTDRLGARSQLRERAGIPGRYDRDPPEVRVLPLLLPATTTAASSTTVTIATPTATTVSNITITTVTTTPTTVGATVTEWLDRAPPTKAIWVQSPAGPRMWESCRTMPLLGGFSRGSPVSPALSSLQSSVLKTTWLLRAAQISSLTHPIHYSYRVSALGINLGAHTTHPPPPGKVFKIRRQLQHGSVGTCLLTCSVAAIVVSVQVETIRNIPEVERKQGFRKGRIYRESTIWRARRQAGSRMCMCVRCATLSGGVFAESRLAGRPPDCDTASLRGAWRQCHAAATLGTAAVRAGVSTLFPYLPPLAPTPHRLPTPHSPPNPSLPPSTLGSLHIISAYLLSRGPLYNWTGQCSSDNTGGCTQFRVVYHTERNPGNQTSECHFVYLLSFRTGKCASEPKE
ncbi:hypothetical protein PR048_024653 [Dryococelus australis]|uniref:Uncharacterized protein n=1 Tax=Dryococelus australis TaxID=614101 RepID=A0ABQ9GP87_9NEOP|nr:hypothetical protein PR048_024653 [Dryococelus australis]